MKKIKWRTKLYILSIAIIGTTMLLPFMAEMNSYLFTIAFFFTPVFFGVWFLLKSRAEEPNGLICLVISVILCYAFMVLAVRYIGWHYEYELYKYDDNGDGMFSVDEVSPDMEKAMDRFTHDTGRTFAPITAAIASPLYNCFWFVIFNILKNILQKIKSK